MKQRNPKFYAIIIILYLKIAITQLNNSSLQVTTDLRGVHICDMGIAKLKAASEATATTVTPNPKGTYPYMAPEMFGPSHRGTAVYVYAFGCLLIELLGQRKVWAELTSVQIMQKVCGSFSVTPVPPSVNHFCPHTTKAYVNLAVNLIQPIV